MSVQNKKRSSVLMGVVALFITLALICSGVTAGISYGVSAKGIKEKAYSKSTTAAYIVQELMEKQEGYGIDDEVFLENTLDSLCLGYEFDSMIIVRIDNGVMHLVASSKNSGIWDFDTDEIPAGGKIYSQILNEANKEQILKVYNSQGSYYLGYHSLSLNVDGDYSIGTAFSAEQIDSGIVNNMLLFTIPLVLIVAVLLIVMLFFLNRSVIKPIGMISSKMERFTQEYGKGIQRINIQKNNEIGDIATSFNKLSEDIDIMIKDMNAMEEERLNAKVHMDVARRIQQGVVPQKTVMNNESFELCAVIQPAKAVGGDFYDCFMRDDNTLCIVIGDISGKGVSAALFMMMVKAEIRTKMRMGLCPCEVLNSVNDEICSENPEGMFATVFAAVYDIKTHELCFANAGHNPPVIIGKNTHIMQIDNGIALGLFEDAGITDSRIVLEAGDGIMLYTDGVTEAVNGQGEWFGEQRMLSCLNTKTAESMIDRLKERVEMHCDGAVQFDDITVMALVRRSDAVVLKPQLDSLDVIKEMLKNKLNGDIPANIMLACEEAFVNIVSYSGASEVRFSLQKHKDTLIAKMIDDGVEFDPVNTSMPEKDADDFDMGGMGIGLIRQIAKHMSYERKDGCNILQLTFALSEDVDDAD